MKQKWWMMLLVIPLLCRADQRAITEKGEEVILRTDGTWQLVNQSSSISEPMKLNDKKFVKGVNATFAVQSTVNNSKVYIDPKLWRFAKQQSVNSVEYKFLSTGSDLQATLITERIEVPLENIVDIALNNARPAAPDAQIVAQEYRIVNGKKVVMAQMNGTINGIKFTYFGYYYSDADGTTQLIVYTSRNLAEQYRKNAEEFLNGLTF